MKKHLRFTAGMIGTVLAVSSFSAPSFAVGRTDTPKISQNSAGAIYEGETFAETLTPPSKTTYTEGDEIDFSDFEIGTIKMTQKVVDGEVKDSFQRIAYWVNWVSPDCYKIVDSDGKKHDGTEFSKLKAGKYTVLFDSYMEFSETKDHKKVLKIGGTDYKYDVTIIKKDKSEKTTSATTVVTTSTTTNTTQTTTIIDFLSNGPVPQVMNPNLKVGEKTDIILMDYSDSTTEIKVKNPNEDIVKFEKTGSHKGVITAIKAGTAVLDVNGKEVKITVTGETATTTSALTTTSITETTMVVSGDKYHNFFIRKPTMLVGEESDYIIGLEVPDKYTVTIEDESIVKLENLKDGKGKLTALKLGRTYIVCDIPETGEHFRGAINVKYDNAFFGDTNCDMEISLADAVLIMQSIANPAKYGIDGTQSEHITQNGQENGDVYGLGDGITNSDALTIQKHMLGLVEELDPWKRES